jgi:hypothetical protein
MNNYLAQATGISSGKIIRYLIDSADSSGFTFKLLRCWTDACYQLWKHDQLFPPQKTRGSIVYMVMTGDLFLRSRCDVIMCTFGVTLHPSRIIFVGETSSDSRLPIYDVVTPDTPRPVNRDGSMQN